MKKGIQILTLIVFSLVLFPFITAQPPSFNAVVSDAQVSIDFTKINILQIDKTFSFDTHASNSTSGKRFDNSTVWCIFELNNQTGDHLIPEFNMSWDVVGQDFEIEVLGGNFSSIGIYSYLVYCETFSGLGGTVAISLEVTNTGFILTEAETIVYLSLLLGIFLIFLLSLFGAVVLPIKNKRNGLNEVIDVDFLKYAKVSLIFVTYLIFVWIINLLLAMTINFNILTQFNGFFNMVFLILMALSWPLFVIMLIVFFVMGANDLQLFKYLSRGLDIT